MHACLSPYVCVCASMCLLRMEGGGRAQEGTQNTLSATKSIYFSSVHKHNLHCVNESIINNTQLSDITKIYCPGNQLNTVKQSRLETHIIHSVCVLQIKLKRIVKQISAR